MADVTHHNELDILKNLEHKLTCVVCLEPFTDPKLLQCNHVFCKECLVALQTKNREGKTQINCPTCCKPTSLSSSGVDELQDDYRMNKLFDIQRDLMSQYLSKSNHNCSLSEGDHYCTKHAGIKLELFCDECSEFVCIQCALHSHNGHTYDIICDMVEICEKEIASAIEPLEDRRVLLKKDIAQLSRKSTEIVKRQAMIREAIEDQTQQLQNALEERKNSLTAQLDAISNNKLTTLSRGKHTLTTALRDMDAYLNKVEEHLKVTSKEDILKQKRSLVQQITDITSTPQSPVVSQDNSTIKFLASPDDLLERCSTHGKVFAHNVSPSNCQLATTSSNWDRIDMNETLCLDMEVRDSIGGFTDQPVMLMQCELVCALTYTTRKCDVERQEPHHYKISCKPISKGRHHLHIKVEGDHISGSPFELTSLLPTHNLGVPMTTIQNITKPRSLEVDGAGNLIITESTNHCVSVYSKKGEKLNSFSSHGNQLGLLDDPRGIAINKDGNILVVDGNNRRIQAFDEEGTFLRAGQVQGCLYNYLTGIAISPTDQKIFVVDSSNHCIQVFDSEMTWCASIGRQGSGKVQFQFPLDVACDSEGKLYVADCDNHRIQVLTHEGKFIRKFGKVGQGKGDLKNPAGVSIGPNNLVYVCESGNNRVSVFTPDGKCVTTFGKEGKKLGEFSSPRAIKVDVDDLCYVCDTGNNRIQIF